MLRVTSRTTAGPLSKPKIRHKGDIDSRGGGGGRFEDYRWDEGIGRQYKPNYAHNRRVFTSKDHKIVLPNKNLHSRLLENTKNKFSAIAIKTEKNNFTSVNHSRNLRPFSNA